jgi:hypothetical protein
LDAYIYEKAVEGVSPPFKYNWPGIVATLALLLINLMSRDQLMEASTEMEEGSGVSTA